MPIAINGTGTITGISVGGLPDAIITGAELDGAQTGSAPIYGARAWVNFNGTGTVAIRASGNVSSITDDGAGLFTLNFTNAMPDTNYLIVGTVGYYSGGNYPGAISPQLSSSSAYSSKTTSSVQINTASATDCFDNNVAVFR